MHLRRSRAPLVPPGTLARTPAWGGMLVSFFVGAALIAALIDIPLFARTTVYSDSQLMAALVLVRLLVALPVGAVVGGYLSREDYRSLREDGAIGDVATVFYRADGSWRDIRLNARATGPGLDRLRRVPRRVCVVSGVTKLGSLQAAIAAGTITDVVLDETLARELAEQA